MLYVIGISTYPLHFPLNQYVYGLGELFIHHLINFSVAEELFMKSLKMYETLVGENHLKTLQPLKNLGTFYMQRNR